MSVPNWYELILLSLASWRLWHLLALDDITERPRRYVTRLKAEWTKEGDATGDDYREGLSNWISCPYCAGWWVAIVWWIAWLIFPTEVLYATVPFALSAGVIASDRILSSD